MGISKNSQQRREYQRLWRQHWRLDPKNRVKQAKSAAACRARHLAKCRERDRAARKANPEKFRARDRARYKTRAGKLKEARRRFKEQEPDNARLRTFKHTLKKYGLTLAMYRALQRKQNYCCASCGADEWECTHGRLVVDHDHVLEVVRGLLCDSCNRTIGHAKENRRRLMQCAEYLKGWT